MEYTNSPLAEYTRLSQAHSGQKTHGIDRITPHCVVGQLSAETLGEWFYPRSNGVSANYAIDCNGRIGLYVKEKNRSWCSSNAENDNRAVTIECASDKTHPYAFRDVVYQRLVALCADICKRYGKTKLLWIPDKAKALAYQPAEDEMLLTVHRWFLDTVCPGEWLMQRMGDLAERVTALLADGEPEESEEYADDGPEAVTPPADSVTHKDEAPVHSAYLLGAMNGDVLRYAGLAGCTDYRKAAQIIKAGGYATAPDYVDALCQIIEMWGLTQWDVKPEEHQLQESPKQDEQLVGGNTTVTLSREDWDTLMNALNVASQILDKYESE